MVELLKHDFKILASQWKKNLVTLLFLPIAIYLLGPNPEFGPDSELYIHPVLSILVLLVGILISTTNELTSVVMNSLPTKKVEIVRSRFIFMIINTFIITIYLLLVAYLLRNSGHGVYVQNGNNILAFLNVAFTTLAILMPISFLSAKGLDIVLMIMFFITMGFGWGIWKIALSHTIYFALITIIVLVLSYLISKQFFNEKEFD